MTAEEIRAYIERTSMKDPGGHYSLFLSEIDAIYDLSRTDPFRAICLDFDYGKAKGYRLARSKQKHRKGAAA